MATVILASGTTAADSLDVTVAAGTPVTIFISVGTDVPAPSSASCDVKIKDAGGKYHTIGRLTGSNPARVIDAPGTYRVSRALTNEAFAVETS